MSNKFIAGLRDPFSAQDAATKNYADNNDNLRVLKTGDTMTGNLSMTNSKITDLATPSEQNDAAILSSTSMQNVLKITLAI